MYIKRDLQDVIKKYLSAPEILSIMGPRQCGKSTLLEHLSDKLTGVNLISFEDVDTLTLFENDIKAFAKLYAEDYRYLFIDEVQYAKTFGKNMKFLYDTYKNKIKFIITGSSATDFYLNGLKYLTGRIFLFNLYPFSFREFLRARNEKLITLVNKKALQPELAKLLDEFIKYGGYPRAVLANDIEEKKIVLKNIYNILVQREITGLAKLADQQKIITLVKLLSTQTANLINYSGLAQQCSMNQLQVKGLLSLFEKTFLIKLLPPFYTNKQSEIVKNPKVFFIDTGLRNAILDNFSTFRTDMGIQYESLIFEELVKQDVKFNYWRTKTKAEVDFVIQQDQKLIPLEVKLGNAKITRSFRSFINQYEPEAGIIFNSELQDQTHIEGTRVYKQFFSEIIQLKKWLESH